MTYLLIFIVTITLLIIGKIIQRFLKATKKPRLHPLPPEHAYAIPMGAVDVHDPPPYTLCIDHTDSYNMLYIPGNAALGAYSAGIACALQQKQDFHTIVGISSGALATLFLYAKDMDTLQRALTHMDTQKILSLKPPLFSLIFGYSFADNSLLQSFLKDFISDDFIDRLKQQHALGYRAYVISHNIDSADSIFWDIGKIASTHISYADRRTQLIQAVVASTALPMVFNPIRIPVTVKGTTYTQTHVDGAVSAHTVFADWMIPENIGNFTKKTLTITQSISCHDIMPIKPAPWKTIVIGLKSLSNAYRGAYYASLKSTAVFADTHNISVRINRIDDTTILTENNMDFSNATINLYFNAGLKEQQHNKIVWHDLRDIHNRT